MKIKISLSTIISLSLLMGTLPTQAKESTHRDITRKALRCSWHVTKMGAGCASTLLGGALLAINTLCRLHKDTATTLIGRLVDEDDTSEDKNIRSDIKNTFESANWIVGGLGLAIFIPGIVVVKKGYNDLKKEFSNSEEDQEKNGSEEEPKEA